MAKVSALMRYVDMIRVLKYSSNPYCDIAPFFSCFSSCTLPCVCARQRFVQAAVMQIVASFEAPIELLSVNKRTATEIKFEVQNTAAGRKAAFILGFKGGDVGA